ncbi:MAG TPA: 5'-nucleotidase, lipoprotein e(P4) family, partial [Flavobacteriia bacterium]|nr:5'-nucleotidase, lipoprotein e(P4) family [Flavobacteriia bacterium]
ASYKGKQTLGPLAIITDIDETVLDNSPFNARMVINGDKFTRESWLAWGKELKAKPVPGALDFFTEAYNMGITIFYVSNRYDEQKPETIANLKKVGFPGVDENHVLLRKETSSKEPRRKQIAENFQIIMLFGDNLTDFSEEFEKQPTAKRNTLVEKMKDLFGKKYIVLPNPIYGDWETKGIFENSYEWTGKQKDSIRKAKLRLN